MVNGSIRDGKTEGGLGSTVAVTVVHDTNRRIRLHDMSTCLHDQNNEHGTIAVARSSLQTLGVKSAEILSSELN